MQKPLVVVLVGQLLVLMGALGFLASRGAPPPPPAPAQVPVEQAEVAPPVPAPEGVEWAAFPQTPPAAAKEDGPSELDSILAQLVEGNARFVEGVSRQRDVAALRQALGEGERAAAVVVTCTDSRVVPELLFDQPLGTFVVVRLPGAQLDEVAVRAVEESVSRLQVQTVLLLGHLGCHHVQAAAAEGKSPRPGTLAAALKGLSDEAATTASVSFWAAELQRKSKLTALRVVYAPKTGKVRWLDIDPPS